LSAGCVVLAGCGGASRTAPPRPAAERVCNGASGAATALLGYAVRSHIADRDPANLECVLHGRKLRVEIVSQASTRAYTEFDTTTSHQDQVYGPGVHEPGQIPVQISVPGSVVAVWIRAEQEIVATDATPTSGGAYVTVTITGRSSRKQKARMLAQALARATFAAHPDTAP
jgi:hypothetical protein